MIGRLMMGAALLAMAGTATAGTKTYKYDAKGRLVKVERTGNQTNTICYDKANNRTDYKSSSTGVVLSCVPVHAGGTGS